MAITTFERVEQKYLITQDQKDRLCAFLNEKMTLDAFCLNNQTYRIRNIYLDSSDNRLIRTSLFKPNYKEKLRLRKYDGQEGMFIEIKKKYNGVVSKRRTQISEEELTNWLEHNVVPCRTSYQSRQIIREIDYLIRQYQVNKKAYIAYDRLGYFDKENPELRVTFDQNLRYRLDDLSWSDENYQNIIPTDKFVLEIKDSINLPIWLIQKLNELKIVKSSFSKYGTEYVKTLTEGSNYAQ